MGQQARITFDPIYYDHKGRPIGQLLDNLQAVTTTDLKTLKPDSRQSLIVETSGLRRATIKTLYDALKPDGILYYRPSNKDDWPKEEKPKKAKPRPSTAKLIPDKQIVNPFRVKRRVRYEDGMPVYDEEPDGTVERELADILAAYSYVQERPEDDITADSEVILSGLPTQCCVNLNIKGYALTKTNLEDVLRVIKPEGRIKFKP